MSNREVSASPVAEDNSENIFPEEVPLLTSPLQVSSKGDCRLSFKCGTERTALTSLQLNSDCGSETLRTTNSLEVTSDAKDFAAGPVLNKELPSVPFQRTEEATLPTDENHFSSDTGSSSKSCPNPLSSATTSPSPLKQITTQSGNLETTVDTSNCSFEDLPSSKEVSFNLPPGYSEWVQSQAAIPPTTSSVQTLSNIVTTVLENNPEIYPQRNEAPEGVDLTEELPLVLPSVATQLLQRSGVLQEIQSEPNLSDSLSDLICQFSELNVEDHTQTLPTLQSISNKPVVLESGSYELTANTAACFPDPSDCFQVDFVSEAEFLQPTDSEGPLFETTTVANTTSEPQQNDLENKPVAYVDAEQSEVLCSDVSQVVADILSEINNVQSESAPVKPEPIVSSNETSCGASSQVQLDSTSEVINIEVEATPNEIKNTISCGLNCAADKSTAQSDSSSEVNSVKVETSSVLPESSVSISESCAADNSQARSESSSEANKGEVETFCVELESTVSSNLNCASESCEAQPKSSSEGKEGEVGSPVEPESTVSSNVNCAADSSQAQSKSSSKANNFEAHNSPLELESSDSSCANCATDSSQPQSGSSSEVNNFEAEATLAEHECAGSSNVNCPAENCEVQSNIFSEVNVEETTTPVEPVCAVLPDVSCAEDDSQAHSDSSSIAHSAVEYISTASTQITADLTDPSPLPQSFDLESISEFGSDRSPVSEAGKDICASAESFSLQEENQVVTSCHVESTFAPVAPADESNHKLQVLNTEVTTEEPLSENIPNTRNSVDVGVREVESVGEAVLPEVTNSEVLSVNNTVVNVDEESAHFPVDKLNTTDALFLEFNLNAKEQLNHQAPLKSLLDSTLTEECDTPSVNQNCVASSPQLVPPTHSEQVVLEVPAKTQEVLKEDQCFAPDTCTLPNSISTDTKTSPKLAAKDIVHEDFTVNSLDNLPVVDTTEFERLIEQSKVSDMPMHMMEAHMDHQWHQNDQMNTMVGDNNCDVDVNVNQCCPMQGNNYHNMDANLTTLSQMNSDSVDSVNSSPNKRKNDEDSAFEDLATVEDANSDLVDDHIMDDQVEEIGVAAVSRRSPSQTRIREPSPKPKGVSRDGSSIVTDPPAINHSEAGPVVAEFTDEELRAAAEVFKDPSTFEFLERVSNSKAFEESSLSRLSLYVKFDPLVTKKSQENQTRSTFKKPVAPQKKSVPLVQEGSAPEAELIATGNYSASPPVHRRDVDAHKLIDFHSPNPPQTVARANPKMVPVEPVQRIENMSCKVFTEDDMKKALKINELMLNERVIKKEKEMAEAESKYQALVDAEKERNNVLQESLTFTRRLLEESCQMVRQWQEKKELERVEVTRERDQALEDLRSVEASFSELHRRYEKIKAVLEGYKQNEEGLRIQLLDTQEKLRNQEQMYEALKQHSKEKLDSANVEIENTKKAGGSEIAVLRSQLMKAEMKVNSLERSLEHKAQEYMQLTAIYDDLVARVSGSQ